MKNKKRRARNIILIIFIIIIPVLITLFLLTYLKTHTRNNFRHNEIWKEYVQREGFFISSDMAISEYAQAISMLRDYGVDVNDLTIDFSDEEFESFLNVVSKGAKAKNLGLKRPNLLSSQLYRSDNNEVFELRDFTLLPKAIKHLSEMKLREGDVENSLLLGKLNFAIGVQFSEYDVDYLQMVGVACKKLGLETLAECAEAKNDAELMKFATDMREKCNQEFEWIRNNPSMPSFWDIMDSLNDETKKNN